MTETGRESEMCVQRQRQQVADVAVSQVTREAIHEIVTTEHCFLSGTLVPLLVLPRKPETSKLETT